MSWTRNNWILTHFFHHFRRCISQMQWHWWQWSFPITYISFASQQSVIRLQIDKLKINKDFQELEEFISDLPAFRCPSKIDGTLSNDAISFGHAKQLYRIKGWQSDANRLRIGQTCNYMNLFELCSSEHFTEYSPISSLAARTKRRQIYRGSSPPSIIRVHQYSDAFSSEARIDLCNADIIS